MDQERLTQLYREHLKQLEAAYAGALSDHGYDAVVIHSGLPKQRTEFDDQYWPLRVTPHFQHWLPLAEADCALVIATGKRPKLIWHRPSDFWETPGEVEGSHWQASFDIAEASTPDAVRELLPPRGRTAFLGEERARAASWGFAPEHVTPKPLVDALDQLRAKKTAYEVFCLAEANRRAALGHTALAKAFRSGDPTELELHLEFLRATEQDATETPYKNIVALGPNAATLHHVNYRKTRDSRATSESLLVDAGATCFGYCSDITRTYVKGNAAAATAFGSLIASVEAFQQQLCAAVAIGDKYEALHDRAHFEVARALRTAGVTTVSDEQAVASGVTRAFFPHGLGHSLGLQCHDVGCALIKPRPDNPFLRNTSTIAEGQCFTIEPGIYFIASLLDRIEHGPHAAAVDWKLVRKLASYGGIRIEDDLVVTGDATVTRNLTREVLPG
jgi:Xaa-Pro dipeptidase